jgi:L-alanine-DL-glutamate epimerase-like enolase superfamily enzyme
VTTITRFETRMSSVPLTRPWEAGGTVFGIVATHVVRSDGVEGWGFTWTPRVGVEAVHALLAHDIAATAVGRTADPRALWQPMWEHLHELGGGIATIALAGLDLALWDAEARAAGTSVSGLLGRARTRARAYGSGVNRYYTRADLLAQVTRWIEAGSLAVKIKVGRPDLAEDVDRVAAVRDLLGPDRALMIDANQRWDLDTATRAMAALEPFAPAWIEEPLRADDLAGHAELARRISTPIAMGENLHSIHRFRDAIVTGAAQIVQPNVVRVGGITPFLEIAQLAAKHRTTLHPHLLPELSGQLALTLPAVPGVPEPMVEDVEDAGFAQLGTLADPSPISIADGWLTEEPHTGLGMRFSPVL